MPDAPVAPLGQVTASSAYQRASSINENTAAAVFVISHHVVDYAQIPLKTFIAVAMKRMFR